MTVGHLPLITLELKSQLISLLSFSRANQQLSLFHFASFFFSGQGERWQGKSAAEQAPSRNNRPGLLRWCGDALRHAGTAEIMGSWIDGETRRRTFDGCSGEVAGEKHRELGL